MELSPQLRQLRDFYYKTALKLAPDQAMAHAPGLLDRPAFFTLEHLKQHLNNPLLMPGWFDLFWPARKMAHQQGNGRSNDGGGQVPVERPPVDRPIWARYRRRTSRWSKTPLPCTSA